MNPELSLQEKKMRGTTRADRPASNFQQGTLVTDKMKYLKKSDYDKLSNRGKAIFRQVCSSLIERSALYLEDITELIMYANCLDRYWILNDKLKEQGEIIEEVSREGNSRYVKNPAFDMQNIMLRNVLDIGGRFGFSPADRQKLKAITVEKSDPLAEFMKKYGADNQ